MSIRLRVIVEIEYGGATDEDDQDLRDHLATWIHSSTRSGMLIDERLEARDIEVMQVASACERLEDAPPEGPPNEEVSKGGEIREKT